MEKLNILNEDKKQKLLSTLKQTDHKELTESEMVEYDAKYGYFSKPEED